MTGAGRLLIAGVGYRNLRDHSLGVVAADALAALATPPGVCVEDLSFNPVAVVQRLEDEPPGDGFARCIFMAATPRADGRAPGTIAAYRWDGVLPAADEIQQAIAEAVTGVIHLDNTLIVARHFGALPDEVVVVEVEPRDHEFGDEFSPEVAGAFDRVCALVMSLAVGATHADTLPLAALGGRPRGLAITRPERVNGRRL